MTIENNWFDFLSLIIQFLIAVGTISAVIVSLWQSKISLREMCKVSMEVGIKMEYNGKIYFKKNIEYDDNIKNKIIIINIRNTGIRKLYINIIYVYDILSKKAFILKTEEDICLDSGEFRIFENNVFFNSNFIPLYKGIFLAKYRLYFVVETKFGTRFRVRLPRYLIETLKKNPSSFSDQSTASASREAIPTDAKVPGNNHIPGNGGGTA